MVPRMAEGSRPEVRRSSSRVMPYSSSVFSRTDRISQSLSNRFPSKTPRATVVFPMSMASSMVQPPYSGRASIIIDSQNFCRGQEDSLPFLFYHESRPEVDPAEYPLHAPSFPPNITTCPARIFHFCLERP